MSHATVAPSAGSSSGVAVDLLATASHYVDHLLPIWEALPAAERRYFYLGPRAWRDDIAGARRQDRLVRDGDVPILTVAHGDFKLARAGRRRHIALGQHGAGQSYSSDHSSYPGGKDQGEVELFLVPNQHAAERTLARYPRARVAIVGCPKLEGLPRKRRRSGPPVVAVSFHFDSSVAPETKSAWPAYRAHIAALGRSSSFRLLGHAHPRAAAQLGPWFRSNRIEFTPSLADVFARADLYICDNSSSLFEFAATGRPVLVLNAPWFRRRQRHGLRFWDAAGVGINVDRGRDLHPAILRALEDPPEVRTARKAALGLVYQPRRGATRLAVRAVLDWSAAVAATLPKRNLATVPAPA